MFPRDMVCLRNISVDTLHKEETEDDDDDDDNNNNNNNTPCSRDLLQKLTSSQLDKKFPAFYGT
jgi:hypothetical protein